MKKYMVYIPETGYYLDRTMCFQPTFKQLCIWHIEKEEVEKIVRIDSERHNYKYRIVEVKENVS